MKKYRVTLTRLVEEECCVYVDAKDEAEATEQALSTTDEDFIPDAIWIRSPCEPHTYSVEKLELAD